MQDDVYQRSSLSDNRQSNRPVSPLIPVAASTAFKKEMHQEYTDESPTNDPPQRRNMSQDNRQSTSFKEEVACFRPPVDDNQFYSLPTEVRHVSADRAQHVSMSPLRDDHSSRLEESRREVQASRLELDASRAEMILMGADMKHIKTELQSAQMRLTECLANDMQGPDNLSMYSDDRDNRPSRPDNRSSRFDSRNNSDMQRPPRPKFNLRTGKDVEQYTIDEFVSTMDDYVKPFAPDSDELRACIKSHLTGEAASVVLDADAQTWEEMKAALLLHYQPDGEDRTHMAALEYMR